MKKLTVGLVAGVALCGASLTSRPATAMSVSSLTDAPSTLAMHFQNVGNVCGPHRCGWRPSHYSGPYNVGPYYAPHVYGYGPPGYGYGPAWYAGGMNGPGWYGYRGRWWRW
jgi:hypothetical protein